LDKLLKGCADPRTFGKPLRGELNGLWRYRVQDYRLISELKDDQFIVILVKTGHRSSVYD
jgi:mRNA interferase RelE/StbE